MDTIWVIGSCDKTVGFSEEFSSDEKVNEFLNKESEPGFYVVHFCDEYVNNISVIEVEIKLNCDGTYVRNVVLRSGVQF